MFKSSRHTEWLQHLKQSGSVSWIRVGLEVFINKSRLAFLSSFPADQSAWLIWSSCIVWQQVTSLFSFCSASVSVDAAPGLSSEMSLTFSRPAVGPLEIMLILLAWFGNLIPERSKSCFKEQTEATTFFLVRPWDDAADWPLVLLYFRVLHSL